MASQKKRNNQRHSFHLVDPSPWPLVGAFSALMLTFGAVMYMHGYQGGGFLLSFGFFMILFTMEGRILLRSETISRDLSKILLAADLFPFFIREPKNLL